MPQLGHLGNMWNYWLTLITDLFEVPFWKYSVAIAQQFPFFGWLCIWLLLVWLRCQLLWWKRWVPSMSSDFCSICSNRIAFCLFLSQLDPIISSIWMVNFALCTKSLNAILFEHQYTNINICVNICVLLVVGSLN